VFRVAAAYGVVAWLIIEVTDVIVPALHLPEWVITAVVVAALVGFPVALLLSWLFDITTDGIVRTRPADDDDHRIRRLSRRGIDAVIIGVLLAVIAYLVYEQDPFTEEEDERSIAVLPFQDISANRDNEYFSDGISEELLNTLVGVDGLRVAARTSSFAFKGRDEDVRSIARKLNVTTVLAGSVRRDGDRVRITATLIDATDGFQLWSETYDRRLDNIFEIQAEISRSIVDELRLELIGESPRMVAAVDQSVDIRAYDIYLAGRHHWHARTPDSLRRALDLFQQAIEIDENFALAYTGLADTYLLMEGYGDLTKEEATARAETPVARALALDDSLSEAYASLGLLRLNQGDMSAAELALRAAVDLNRNNSMAHMWLGLALQENVGPRAALDEYERALRLDVFHPTINQNVAHTRATTGQFEEAVAGLRSLIDNGPEMGKAVYVLASLYNDYGHYDEAVRWSRELVATGDDPGWGYVELAEAMLALGDYPTAERHLSEAERRLAANSIDADLMGLRAEIYLAQGRFDELGVLAGTPGAHAKPNDLIWAGVSRVAGGDGAGASELFQAVLNSPMAPHMEPAERIAVRSAAAWAENVAGRADAVGQHTSQAEADYQEALARGWDTPQLHAWAALSEFLADRHDVALSRLRVAVDKGWRETRVLGELPMFVEMREQPDFRELLDWVDQDLDRMSRAVAAARAGPDVDGPSVASR
jgi:TolB-like protein/tetratricopeptide (TPR) repeat protein